jgi:hypothetical protein
VEAGFKGWRGEGGNARASLVKRAHALMRTPSHSAAAATCRQSARRAGPAGHPARAGPPPGPGFAADGQPQGRAEPRYRRAPTGSADQPTAMGQPKPHGAGDLLQQRGPGGIVGLPVLPHHVPQHPPAAPNPPTPVIQPIALQRRSIILQSTPPPPPAPHPGRLRCTSIPASPQSRQSRRYKGRSWRGLDRTGR